VGKRTSVYLPDDIATLAAQSPLTLAELITRGLACPGHDPRPAPAPRERGMVLGEPCKHPPARIHRGLCGCCGTYVGERARK
jgi:hypothetical protein